MGRPSMALHADSVKAQSLMLEAMRHAMGSNPQILCSGLSQHILPTLCQAVDAEAEAAVHESEPAWRSAQVLFATLAISLPPSDAPSSVADHPALAIWRSRWLYLEAALLRWPPSAATDQPLAAAAEALASAAVALPALLPEALQLLTRSATQHETPQMQLSAFRKIATGVPCPPVDPKVAAGHLAASICGTAEVMLSRQAVFIEDPSTVTVLFSLLADSVRLSSNGVGLCDDQLRPLVLAQPVLVSRCLSLVGLVLPECNNQNAASAMLRFLADLVGSGDCELPANAPHRPPLVAALPELCAALCDALASQE